MHLSGRRFLRMQVIAVALACTPGLVRARQGDDAVDERRVEADEGGEEGRCAFQDRDFYVSHVSTLPANAGQEVKLFVRERGNSCGPPVLMLTGATQPAMVTFDLPFQDYSWMTHLADAGFDVFAMDLQGYGFSTRPDVMDDPCNASTTVQKSLLTPNPLKEPCSAIPSIYPYPFRLTDNQSEWNQIDSVVDYIRATRRRERVSLVGWSQGGARAGGYASEHPEKVERLFLYAPVYNRGDPTAPPVLPQPGFPLAVSAVADFFARWDSQATCANQFDPAIRAQLTASLLHFDPLAATWGTKPLWRSPSFNPFFGWNSVAAAKLHMPILLIRGDNDIQVPLSHVTDLFADVSSESRVFVHVACGAHQLVWDRQHTRLLDASVQWLREGRYDGERNGCFAVDVNGIATPDPDIAAPCSPTTGREDDSTESEFTVGHRTFQLDVIGTRDEHRPVKVDVWYPSHDRDGELTSYTSALHGVPLVPSMWDPLAWKIPAESAKEGLSVAAPAGDDGGDEADDGGPGFPVIVFSHGSTDLPLDYYVTLERLAARGFVVAAPAHVNNTADDVKRDLVNRLAGHTVLSCVDGLPPPCSRASVPDSMADRVRDVGAVIDALPEWFGNRVDTSRVGLLGHSRGSVTALLEAGGSSAWGIARDTRHPIKGIMGLSIGVAGITFKVDLANVTIPTVLVDGTLSQYLPVAQTAIGQISSQQKLMVVVKNAVHRTFSSGICRMTQASGAVAEMGGSRALLDRQTIEEALTSGNGTALNFCLYSDFTSPTDITPITREITGVQVTPSTVPSTGLSSIAEAQEIVDLAATFFGNVLSLGHHDGDDITRGMKDGWLEQPDLSEVPDLSSDLAAEEERCVDGICGD